MCGACNRFKQQLRLLSNAVQRIKHDTENDNSIQLPLDAKVRISQKLSSMTASNHH
jgi:hypothetical protein